jgi:hypothetical protein
MAKLLELYMNCIRSGLFLLLSMLLVQSIVTSVHCDVADAVKAVIDKDSYGDLKRLGPVEKEWYRHWGAEIALTLALVDTSTLSPNAVGRGQVYVPTSRRV